MRSSARGHVQPLTAIAPSRLRFSLLMFCKTCSRFCIASTPFLASSYGRVTYGCNVVDQSFALLLKVRSLRWRTWFICVRHLVRIVERKLLHAHDHQGLFLRCCLDASLTRSACGGLGITLRRGNIPMRAMPLAPRCGRWWSQTMSSQFLSRSMSSHVNKCLHVLGSRARTGTIWTLTMSSVGE